MNNSLKKEFTRLSLGHTAYAECSGEYVLPDYMGDVRKVLFTSAEVHPASRFDDGGKVELGGVVTYDVVYLDNDGELWGVSFSSDYDADVKTGTEEPTGGFDTTRVSAFNVRLVGPRKFSAKATVSVSVDSAYSDSFEVGGNAFDGDDVPEVLTERVRMESRLRTDTVEREFAETVLRLDGAIADEVSVLYKTADVSVGNIEVNDGYAELGGNLTLMALVKNGEEPLRVAERSVPFDIRFAVGEIKGDMSLIPDAHISSVTANVNPDENGVDVVMTAILELALSAEYNSEYEMITDAYSRNMPTENSYNDFSYTEIAFSECGTGEVVINLPRSDFECEEMREIALMRAVPKVENVSYEGGRVAISGEMRFYGIASEAGGEKLTYAPVKLSREFVYYAKCIELSDASDIAATLEATEVLPIIDGDTVELTVKCRHRITARENKTLRVLASMSCSGDGKYESVPGRIIVYYPEKGETLFEIAKRFHTTPAAIARDNALSETVSTAGGTVTAERLMIL